jgi:REP element-mobilizing transposase RayT
LGDTAVYVVCKSGFNFYLHKTTNTILTVMAVKNASHESSGVFFITFTCSKWIPLFEIVNAYDVVYKWFDYLKSNGHYVFSYVIMPNHLHCMIGLRENEAGINKIVSNGKRFMAYELVKRLQSTGNIDVLQKLEEAVSISDRKKGKLHQVFEHSFDCKACYSEPFILQKLNYIHQNPLRGKWQLAFSPSEYLHSSALFYETGKQGIYPVTHINSLGELEFGIG